MMKKLRGIFRPPIFENDEEKTNSSELIHFIVLGMVTATLLYTVFARVADPAKLYIIVIPLLTIQFGALLANRRGFVRQAGMGLVAGTWLLFFYASYVNGGVRAPGFSGFIVIVMVATFAIGHQWGFLIAGASICAGILFISLEGKGMLPQALDPPSLSNVLLGQITFFIVAAVLLRFAIRNTRRALEQSRINEERYRLITSVMSDYAFFTQFPGDGKVKEQWVTGAFEPMTGYTSDEFFERGGWEKLLYPDDKEQDKRDMAQLEANKKVISEVRIIRKDGVTRWVRSYAHPKWDEELNRLEGIYGAVQDITESKNIEMNLRQREAILSVVAQTANLFLKKSDWRTEINSFLENIGKVMNVCHAYIFENHVLENGGLGFSIRYEWNNPNVSSDLDNPTYINRAWDTPDLRVWRETMESQLPYIGDKEHYPKSELILIADDDIKSLLDVPIIVDGKWWGIIGFDDVESERIWTRSEVEALIVAANAIGSAIQHQSMDDALKYSEEKFFRAFHSTPVLMTIERTTTSKLLDANQAFLDAFGLARNDVLGKSVSELGIIYDGDDLKRLREIYQRDGKLRNFEIQFRKSSGGIGVAILSADDFVVNGESYTLTSGLDITERKRSEEERERLITELGKKNEELERFTYTVSHDLKSPLVTINGFLGYLNQDVASGNMERFRNDLHRIESSVVKMQSLLDELLELSRIGRMMNPPATISFEQLCHDVLETVQGLLNEHGVTVQIQPNLPMVHGDGQRLMEVLQNLIENAAKYMGDQPDPLIEIGVDGEEDGKPVFYVRDNGIGIAPEFHDRIFGLFNKLDPNSEGTGVGLTLVKRIIEVHGGRIWVESDIGQGAVFNFTLPVAKTTPRFDR